MEWAAHFHPMLLSTSRYFEPVCPLLQLAFYVTPFSHSFLQLLNYALLARTFLDEDSLENVINSLTNVYSPIQRGSVATERKKKNGYLRAIKQNCESRVFWKALPFLLDLTGHIDELSASGRSKMVVHLKTMCEFPVSFFSSMFLVYRNLVWTALSAFWQKLRFTFCQHRPDHQGQRLLTVCSWHILPKLF